MTRSHIQINNGKRKIIKGATMIDLLENVKQNAKNGWEAISEIKFDISFDMSQPWQVLVERKVS